MSQCNWAILGTGFKLYYDLDLNYTELMNRVFSDNWLKETAVKKDFLTSNECLTATKEEVENIAREYVFEEGTTFFFYEKQRELFGDTVLPFGIGDDGGDREFLMLWNVSVWEVHPDLYHKSKEEVIEMFIDLILPLTTNTKAELLERINDINTYGMG